jgi:hypothetical protein
MAIVGEYTKQNWFDVNLWTTHVFPVLLSPTRIKFTFCMCFCIGQKVSHFSHFAEMLGTAWIAKEREHCENQIRIQEVLIDLGLPKRVANYLLGFLVGSRDLGASGGIDYFLSRCVCEYTFNSIWGGFTHNCPAHGSVKTSVGFGYIDGYPGTQTWIDVYGVYARCGQEPTPIKSHLGTAWIVNIDSLKSK